MSEDPKSVWRKPRATPRWLRVWAVMAAVIYLIAIAGLILTTRLHGWQDWLPALLAALGFSAVAAMVLLCLARILRWLACWRNLRRALFGLACLFTVIGLFYAEEDWRGQRAWVRFQREEEAKGVRFDLAGVEPPPVPDDQNFALAPVIASSYGQMLDRTGHEISPANDKLINRLRMFYYAAPGNPPTNGISNWSIGEKTDLTVYQQYYQSLGAQTNLFPLPVRPQSPAADVRLALSRYDAVIEEVRQAGQLPFSRFPLEYDKANPWQIVLPHLAALKQCAGVLCLRATAEGQAGQTESALADVRLQFKLMDSVRQEPLMISQLVRGALLHLLLQPVWEGLAQHQWSESQLAALDAELNRLDFLADYESGMRGDLVFMARETGYLRTHPDQFLHFYDNSGLGNLPVNPYSDATMTLLAQGRMIPSGWFYQNQLGSARVLTEFYLPAADMPQHTFAPALVRQGYDAVKQASQHLSPCNILECLTLQWPVTFDFASKFAHAQSSVDLARVALALERCRRAQGQYPESLDALAPQFIAAVPHDIIGGQPLHYRRTDDGQFVLYSVGWNETDDGGVVVRSQSDPAAQDLSRGDWVWRYPAQ